MKQLFKYPRTSHLPYSPGTHSDDRLLKDVEHLMGLEVIVTEKMDGENTSMYSDHIHARSMDSIDHPSRHFVKGVWGGIRHMIPEGWRVCGENLFAKHSIFYDNLESYFQVYSIWNNDNMALSWIDTEKMCKDLGLKTVPVLHTPFIFDKVTNSVLKLHGDNLNTNKMEGFVIRNTKSFHYQDFDVNVAKWVRAKHVQTSDHWMSQKIIPNKLKKL